MRCLSLLPADRGSYSNVSILLADTFEHALHLTANLKESVIIPCLVIYGAG